MSRPNSERGFTLVELLLAVAILGLVIAPLASAIFVSLRTMDSTSNRLTGSNDAQLLARYFPPDVQSANTWKTGGIPACSGTTTPRRLLLTADSDGAAEAQTVLYWVRKVGGDFELVRSVWNGTSCTAGAAVSTTVVAHNVAAVNAATVQAINVSGVTRGFRMRVREKVAPTDTQQYDFRVSGRMRRA